MARNCVPVWSVVLSSLLLFAGCSSEARFVSNDVYLKVQEKGKGEEFGPAVHEDLGDILVGLFGTPDEPNVPLVAETDVTQIIDADRLKIAAGPVGSDEFGNATGLYREHCAHCHGVSGDGAGPTAAFLKPYPRDYRRGAFKFTSTAEGERPTHEDLKRIVREGIPNTAMPAFKLLLEVEVEALIHYVKYLAIRGEVERELLAELALEDSSERLMTLSNSEDDKPYSEDIGRVKTVLESVVGRWARATSIDVPALSQSWPDDKHDEAIVRGRELFFGKFDCKQCHGDAAIGDGKDDFDPFWVKELNVDPAKTEKREEIDQFLAVGAHPPRRMQPRNLRLGVYRGGRRPIDMYWRVKNGINGAGMPARSANATPADIWAVILYVRSLPHEAISRPPQDKLVNQKDITQ